MSGTRVAIAAGGVDPTGGAGLTADIAFLARLGVRAGTIVTALTVQDDEAVRRVEAVSDDLVAEQLDAAIRTFGDALGAIKTGLVLGAGQAAVVADAAGRLGVPLVVDPVLVAGTGDAFHDGRGGPVGGLLAPLLAAATIVTPNIDEAEALTGLRWDGTHDGLLALAAALSEGGRRIAAVSGGHGGGPTVPLALAGPRGSLLDETPRRTGCSTHGTGCAMAATTAGLIALGREPTDAAVEAHRRVARAVVRAAGLPGRRISPEPWSE